MVFEGVTRVVFEGKSREELGCLVGEFKGHIYKSMKQIKNTKPNEFQKRVLIQLLV